MENQTIEMPALGTYADIITYLPKNKDGKPRSKQTLYKWVKRGDFKKGIYIGRGMFNMKVFLYYLSNNESFLKERR